MCIRDRSKDELISYVTEHKEELEQTAESFMRSEGYAYPADIRIERCYFPTKVYGDVTFPCGDYDAVRVLLGSGQGNNWWCVLYPPLCFSQSSVCEVPDSSKQELKNLLTDNDYRDLMKSRRVVFNEMCIRDRFVSKASWIYSISCPFIVGLDKNILFCFSILHPLFLNTIAFVL